MKKDKWKFLYNLKCLLCDLRKTSSENFDRFDQSLDFQMQADSYPAVLISNTEISTSIPAMQSLYYHQREVLGMSIF
jgi:hypothetical protein